MKASAGTKLSAFHLLFLLSCSTPRYVGTLTERGTFVHRGYGVVVDIPPTWVVVGPGDSRFPPGRWPRLLDEAIDLNGNGQLEPEERVTLERPTLRLVSRSSTVAWVDLQVDLLSAGDPDLDAFVQTREGSNAPTIRRDVPPGFEGLEVRRSRPDGSQWTLYVEQRIEAEWGPRRQRVMVRLRAPEITPGIADRFRSLLDGLVLARRAAPVKPGEVWSPRDGASPALDKKGR